VGFTYIATRLWMADPRSDDAVHQPLWEKTFFEALSATPLRWTVFAQGGGGNSTPKNLIVERQQTIPYKLVGQSVEIDHPRTFSQPDSIHGQEY
jgi:hypothetical protein